MMKYEMGRACNILEQIRNTYDILVWKPEIVRVLKVDPRRWDDNIKWIEEE
jgi:hypothetical protein